MDLIFITIKKKTDRLAGRVINKLNEREKIKKLEWVSNRPIDNDKKNTNTYKTKKTY
jgi:hypothetical protein